MESNDRMLKSFVLKGEDILVDKLSAVVLIGGQSLRMGKDKAFLKYNNQTFLELLLQQLSVCDETLISVNDKNKYQESKHLIVEDEIREIGPLGGIYSCLKVCKNDYLFVCATDMPFLESKIIYFIGEFFSSSYDCFVIKSANKIHPLCAVYHKNCIPIIEKMIEAGNYRLMDLLGELKVKYIPLEYSCFDDEIVSNINTVQAYSALCKPSIVCISGVKNSGKTTLITKIIKTLRSEGYRIAVIKHDGHNFEIDLPNTDTYEHQVAGSDPTIIYSDNKWAMISREKIEIEDLIMKIPNVDLIIIEGLKNSHYPKIEVVRKINGLKSVCDPKYLLAIACDELFQVDGIRILSINNIEEILAIIRVNILKTSL